MLRELIMFASTQVVRVEGGIEFNIASGIVLPKMSNDFIKFLLDLANAGWLTTETVSVGMEITSEFRTQGTLASKNNSLGTPLATNEELQETLYVFPGFKVDTVNSAGNSSNKYIIDMFQNKMVLVEASEQFKESCTLDKLIPKKVSLADNLRVVSRVSTDPSQISKPVPKNVVTPNDFQKRVASYHSEIEEFGEIVFTILIRMKDGEKERKIAIVDFDSFVPAKSACQFESNSSTCDSVFCFHHESYGAHIRDNQEHLSAKHPKLDLYIKTMARAYVFYLNGNPKYRYMMACAIANIPIEDGKKGLGITLLE